MAKGKFIVFEGIDGCGKGTQLKLAHSYLWDLSKEIDIYTTREPTRNFKEIREKMSQDTVAKKDAEWYLDMFVKDRKDHLDSYILPTLKKGTHILCDRYKYSTIAYQNCQGIPLDQLIFAHEGLLIPDLTLIFDCPVEVAFKRRKKDGATDVFEKDIKFQRELRGKYLTLPHLLNKERIVIINSNRNIAETFAEVKKSLNSILH